MPLPFSLLGYQHGRDGIRAYAHRRGRPYDSRNANISYLIGYKRGYRERLSTGKTLDYSRPENNRLFKA